MTPHEYLPPNGETASREPAVVRGIRRWPLLAIAALSLAVTLPGLSSGFLWDRAETLYASRALVIAQSGFQLQPPLGADAWLERGPLAYWMTAGAFALLGVNEFAARLPSALMAVATLLVVYALGAWAVSRTVGLVAAAVLASSVLFGVVSRAALIEPPFVLAATAALACFWRMEAGAHKPTAYAWWSLGGGVALGLAVLTRGATGLLPLVIALVYMTIRAEFSLLRRAMTRLPLGAVAALAVAGMGYYVVAQGAGGDEAVFDAANSARGTVWVVLFALIAGALPWTGFLLAMPFRRRAWDRFDLFLACWSIAVLVVFAAMAPGAPEAISSAMPPLALLLAREIEWRLSGAGRGHPLVAVGWWLGAAVAVALVAAAVLVPRYAPGASFPILLGFSGVLAIGAVWAALDWHLGERVRACVVAGAIWVYFLGFGSIFLLREATTMQPLAAATRDAMELLGEREVAYGEATISGGVGGLRALPPRLLAYRLVELSVFFYSDGRAVFGIEAELNKLVAAVREGPEAFLLAREEDELEVADLLTRARGTFAVVPYEALRFADADLDARLRGSRRFRFRLFRLTKPQVLGASHLDESAPAPLPPSEDATPEAEQSEPDASDAKPSGAP